MHLHRRNFVLGIAATACGARTAADEGDSTPSSSPRPAPPTGGGVVRHLWVGDSITRGVQGGPGGALKGGFRAVVAKWRDSQADLAGVEFVGPVIAGRTASFTSARCWAFSGARIEEFDAGGEHDLARALLPSDPDQRPDVASIMLGTNNLGGRAPEVACELVQSLIAHARALRPDLTLVICTIPPAERRPRNQLIEAYNAGVREVASRTGSRLIDAHACLTPADIGDGSHPYEAGYIKLGTYFQEPLGEVWRGELARARP